MGKKKTKFPHVVNNKRKEWQNIVHISVISVILFATNVLRRILCGVIQMQAIVAAQFISISVFERKHKSSQTYTACLLYTVLCYARYAKRKKPNTSVLVAAGGHARLRAPSSTRLNFNVPVK